MEEAEAKLISVADVEVSDVLNHTAVTDVNEPLDEVLGVPDTHTPIGDLKDVCAGVTDHITADLLTEAINGRDNTHLHTCLY